jgi:hypothetical protein
MLAWGSCDGSVFSAWTVHPISQAKNAESPASITRRLAANGHVSATVRTA